MGRNKPLGVMVTHEEKEALRRAAKANRQSISSYTYYLLYDATRGFTFFRPNSPISDSSAPKSNGDDRNIADESVSLVTA